MILEQYKPSERDTWTWRQANLNDVDAIVALAQTQFQTEIEDFVTPDPRWYAKNVCHAITNQKFDPVSEQLIVAIENNTLIAYAWIQRNVYLPYSKEELAEARFVHLDLTLPKRTRITLLAQILQQWELWATICGVKCLCSSTVRGKQDTFLKLHEQAGYLVRGSIAFKRLDTK